MRTLLILMWIAVQSPVEDAILALSGASCMEELSDDEIERFERLQRHPLALNSASRSTLEASGLLDPFQTASLLEHRNSGGAVRSWTELGLIDGFSPEFVSHLRHFSTLDAGSSPGELAMQRTRAGGTVDVSANARLDVTEEDSSQEYAGTFKGKVRAELELPWGVGVMWQTAPDFSAGKWTFGQISASYSGGGMVSRVILGNYNARLGQGMMAWSGFSLSNFSSIQALSRRATGFTPSASASSLCGAAATLAFGQAMEAALAFSLAGEKRLLGSLRCNGRRLSSGLNFTIDATGALENPGNSDSANGRRNSANGGAGPALDWAVSIDERLSLKSASVFAEGVYDSNDGLALAAGSIYKPAYGYQLALLTRLWSRGYGSRSLVAMAGQWPWGFASLECGAKPSLEHRLRFFATLGKSLALGSVSLSPVLRIVHRTDFTPVRNSSALSSAGGLSLRGDFNRSELRLEVAARLGHLTIKPRYDAVWCSGFSHLGCLELRYDSSDPTTQTGTIPGNHPDIPTGTPLNRLTDLPANQPANHLSGNPANQAAINTEKVPTSNPADNKSLRPKPAFSLSATFGLHDIGSWDSRVYVYHRGTPGSFNLTAYRGLGFFAAGYARLSLGPHSLYLTAHIRRHRTPDTTPQTRLTISAMYRWKF